jgi:hypothetical protein
VVSVIEPFKPFVGGVTMFRPSHVIIGALVLMAAACNDSVSNVVGNIATVRLVNGTDIPLSIASGGVLDTENTKIVFGQSSGCLLVNLSTTSVPTVTLTNGATGASIVFTPVLTGGTSVMVVAYNDAMGHVLLTPLTNAFVPAINGAGLRFFNGVATVGALTMARDSATLTPFVGIGAASNFVSVPLDSGRITFSNTATVVLDAGLMAFPEGQNTTIVVGPPAEGTVPLRFFTAQGC